MMRTLYLTMYTIKSIFLRMLLKWFRKPRMESPTIFGKILNGKIKKEFVYEDDQVVAFESQDKMAEVHILVIPREWIENLKTVNASHTALLGHMLVVAAEIARQQEALIDGDFRISINNGKEAGQTVEHIHVHILGGEPLGRSVQTPKTAEMDARQREKEKAAKGIPLGDRA